MVPRKQRATDVLIALSCIVSFVMGLAACGQGDGSPTASEGSTPSGEIARLVLFDDFEYDVARSATDAEQQFRAHGWTDVKANNSHFGRGNGYLYTRFDPIRNSRVLVMESYPSTASNPPNFPHRQTDYWIKYGAEDAPLNAVPANVWFQFWTYATPESRWHSQKFIYPCRGLYPCSTGRFLWLMGYNRHNLTGIGDGAIEAPPGGRFLHFVGDHANNFGGNPWNRQKLFQNMNQTPLLPGVWYQIRIHVDTSGSQGIYEAWIRQREATTWTKVSEWIGGVTPNFDWPIPLDMRDGNRVFAMPTTVNEEDSVVYLDDFAMATGEAALPTSP